jgi:transposase InsO family protein
VKARGSPKDQKYDPQFRVRVVKTALEKQLSVKEIEKVFKVRQSTYYPWKKVYLEQGEEGLLQHGTGSRRAKKQLPAPVQEKLREQVLEVKRKHPYFGVLRVWQWLLRTMFLPVSFRQVRRTLAEADLIGKVLKKKRKPRKPRRFERTKPNELWATDITEFQLAGGTTVYVIAFMDDHSRYIVSWGIYAGCATELVLEVLRKGISVYGRPTEILSDHGPQFWVRRGKTQFQKFLQREDITPIKASTPEGNGKIEAFWGTMKEEFVERTKRKGDLEEVRDRLAHWINFYNFQRLHTEIDCAPAERYFQYQAAMKAEIQKRIRKNEEELALSKTPPSQVIGQSALGADAVEVRKEGDQFVVRLGDQVLNQTDLDARKETKDATQAGTADEAGRGGQGGEGEGVPCPAGAVGGEDDHGGLQRDGDQADLLLQAGRADGAGDGRRGADAGREGTATEGSPGRGDEPGPGDGTAPPGAPPAGQSDEDLQQALPGEAAEIQEERPGEAERIEPAPDGGDGAGPEAGPAAPASGNPVEET